MTEALREGRMQRGREAVAGAGTGPDKATGWSGRRHEPLPSLNAPFKRSDSERLDAFVYPDPNSGCFLFGGAEDECGYGRFWLLGRMMLAHRAAWLLAGRELPAGALLCHKCDTPPCVNVDHLFLGSHADNALDGARKRRRRLGRGGPLPLGVVNSSSGGRFLVRIWIDGRNK